VTAAGEKRTAVVTITHGRQAHLHRQRLGLVADPPDVHVVVGMDDRPDLGDVAGAAPVTRRWVAPNGAGLPLAAARNAGAEAALDAGAEVVVFLDVDCIPGPRLVSSYAEAAVATPSPALLCGPVSYLPVPPPGGYPSDGLARMATPHPARPVPRPGGLLAEDRFELFWSLSFAVSARSWTDLGGFHEGYVGYGAEDTDFAVSAAAAGARLYWVGGADAYHQYHPPSRHDPVHIAEMTRNARLFHSRHGSWPMRDWLAELATDGAVEFDPDAGVCRASPASSAPSA
jgi:GT2 family glycosyltransferase